MQNGEERTFKRYQRDFDALFREHYAEIVRDLAQHRRLMTIAQSMMQEAFSASDKPAAVMARAVDRIMAARAEQRCHGASPEGGGADNPRLLSRMNDSEDRGPRNIYGRPQGSAMRNKAN